MARRPGGPARGGVRLRPEGHHLVCRPPYANLFTNFACTVGNMGYCGSIPCFRFKVKFVEAGTPFWLNLFFTPTADEDEVLHSTKDEVVTHNHAREGLADQRDTANRFCLKSIKAAASPMAPARRPIGVDPNPPATLMAAQIPLSHSISSSVIAGVR